MTKADSAQTDMTKSKRRLSSRSGAGTWLACLLLAGLVVCVFGRIATHEFVEFDDPYVLQKNMYFKPPVMKTLLHYWNPLTNAMGLYVPVTYTAWWVVSHFAYDPVSKELHSGYFHLASVLVHALNIVLVFKLLRSVLLKATGKDDLRLTFLAAAVWGLHPIQVEAVCWASGLKDLLAGTFVLTSLLLYTSSKSDGRLFDGRTILAIVVGLFGMLAKPSAMVAPALAVLLQLTVFAPPGSMAEGRAARYRREVLRILPWFFFAGLLALWAKHVQYSGGSVYQYDWSIRPFIVTDTLTWYALKIVLPVGLTIDHGRRPDVVMLHSTIWWTWVTPALLAVVAYLLRKRAALFAIGLGWSVLALGPVLGLVPFLFQYYTTVAEHYMYVSMLGVVLSVAGLAAGLSGKPALFLRVVLLGGLIACLYISSLQISLWRTNTRLLEHAIKVAPQSSLANTNLGILIAARGELLAGERLLLRALTIRPTSALVMTNLISVRIRRGNIDGAIYMAKVMIHRVRNDAMYPKEQTAQWAAIVGKVVKNRGDYPTAKRLLEFAVENGAAKEAQADLDEVKQKLDAYNSARIGPGTEVQEPVDSQQNQLSPTTQP